MLVRVGGREELVKGWAWVIKRCLFVLFVLTSFLLGNTTTTSTTASNHCSLN